MDADSNRTLAEEILLIPTGTTSEDGTNIVPEAAKWAELDFDASFPSPSEEDNVIIRNGTDTNDFQNWFVTFLENNDWLLWAAIGAGALFILCIIIVITCWLVNHRKGIIHERKMQERQFERQPSESNLECYKRPNMPQSRSATMSRGGFLSASPYQDNNEIHFTNIESASDVIAIDGIPNNDLHAERYRPLPQPATINNVVPVANY